MIGEEARAVLHLELARSQSWKNQKAWPINFTFFLHYHKFTLCGKKISFSQAPVCRYNCHVGEEGEKLLIIVWEWEWETDIYQCMYLSRKL